MGEEICEVFDEFLADFEDVSPDPPDMRPVCQTCKYVNYIFTKNK